MPLDSGLRLARPRAGSRTRARPARRSRARPRPRARRGRPRAGRARTASRPASSASRGRRASRAASASVAQRVRVRVHDQVRGARCGSRTARSRRSACRPGRARAAGPSSPSRRRTADSNASGRSALPRIEPLTSGIPSSTNSSLIGLDPSRRGQQSVLDRRARRRAIVRREALAPSRRAPRPCSRTPGASSVWSPAKPSACGWVDVTRSPCSNAVSSTSDGDVELDGQERLPVARVDELDAEQEPAAAHLPDDLASPSSAASSSSRRLGPRSRTRSTSPRSTSRSSTARPDGATRAARRPTCARGRTRASRGRWRRRRAGGRARRRAARSPAPSPLPTATMSGSIGSWWAASQLPDAAHAGDHLVEADQEPVPLAALGQALPEALRRASSRAAPPRSPARRRRRRSSRGPASSSRRSSSVERRLAGRIEPPRRRRRGGGGTAR